MIKSIEVQQRSKVRALQDGVSLAERRASNVIKQHLDQGETAGVAGRISGFRMYGLGNQLQSSSERAFCIRVRSVH